MKNVIMMLIVIGIMGCSNKSSQSNNIVQDKINPTELQDTNKLSNTDILITPSVSNLTTMEVSKGQQIIDFDIKNTSAVKGAIKINLNYKLPININSSGTTCGVNSFTKISSLNSCRMSILINTDILSAGVLSFSFTVEDVGNGIINSYQNFISILDPNGTGPTSFPVAPGACKVNYHIESRTCKLDVKNCAVLPTNALIGTQTWASGSYGSCQISQCQPTFVLLNNACSAPLASNIFEMTVMPQSSVVASHLFMITDSTHKPYVWNAQATGTNYIRDISRDTNADNITDTLVTNYKDIVSSSIYTCGTNITTGFIECMYNYGTGVQSMRPVQYDDVGDGSGFAPLPANKIKKIFAHSNATVTSVPATGVPYFYAIMTDNKVISWYGGGISAAQKGVYIKYTNDGTTLAGNLVLDNTTQITTFLSAETSVASNTLVACGISNSKIACWYGQATTAVNAAQNVQADYNDDSVLDGEVDSSTIGYLMPGRGSYGSAVLNTGEAISWRLKGNTTATAAKKVKLYNTTTALSGLNLTKVSSSYTASRYCVLGTSQVYCWLNSGQGALGAQAVVDINSQPIDSTQIKQLISTSGTYAYALKNDGTVWAWASTGVGGNYARNVQMDSNNDGTSDGDLNNIEGPIESSSIIACGVYKNPNNVEKNLMCWQNFGTGTQFARLGLYDSDANAIGDAIFKIDGPNPLQRQIIINKTANQGDVSVNDLLTNAQLGTCPAASASCTILVPDNANITITSTPLAGYSFTNYTDAKCLGTNAICNATAINANTTITPIFSAINYTVTVNVLPANLATEATFVVKRIATICSGACLSTYNKDQLLTVTATPSKYVNNATFDVVGTGLANLNTVTANQMTVNVGTSDIVVNINLTDKALTVPAFVFNGTLSSGLITIPNNPLTITTTNVTMAREMLISESANCSTGTYIPYVSPASYSHSVLTGINPISFMFRNNSQVSACYPYTLKVTNVSKACSPQPTNSVAGTGTQVSSDGGTTFGLCSGFTCNTSYHVNSNMCDADVIACFPSNGTGTQTWNGTAYGACTVSSCNPNYHNELNVCTFNTQSCLITNGSGTKTWNGTAYGACTVSSCSGGYVSYNNQCILIKTRACSPQPTNSTPGTGLEYSYDNGSTYTSCQGFSCTSLYTPVGSLCSQTNQTRACSSQPANSTGGTEATTDGGQSWGACTGFTCSQTNYSASGGQCVFTRPLITNTTTMTINRNGSACSISNGKAYCWGTTGGQTASSLGVYGIASGSVPTVPYPVIDTGALAGKTMTKIVAHDSYICALDNLGKAYCWGTQVPNNGTWASPTAINTTGVLAGKTLIDIAAGSDSVCMVASSGEVFCFGANFANQLGVSSGTLSSSAVPVKANVTGMVSIYAGKDGFSSYCAKNSSNNLYCWGSNYPYGIIGYYDNTSATNYLQPNLYNDNGITTYRLMAFGTVHSCRLSTLNQFSCKGANLFRETGYLGNRFKNTIDYVSNPVSTSIVNSPSSIIDMAGGGYSTCVVYSNNNVQCFGDDFSGNNSPVTAIISTPLAGRGTVKIYMSGYSSSIRGCGINNSGAVYCWYTSDLNGAGSLIQ